MTGSIKKRSEGSWTLIISLGKDPLTGRRRQKWYTVRGNKKAAEAELTRLLHELNTGSYVEPSRSTLAEYLERWLESVKVKVAGKTFERYDDIVRRHLIPGIGSVKLCQLQPLQIQQYYSNELLKGRADGSGGLSAQTVLHHHRVLRSALGRAVKWQLLVRNPAEAVEPPKPQRKEMRALNEAETAWLLHAAMGTRLYVPLALAVTTGMRRGEFLPLQWSDLDLGNRVAFLRRSVEQTKQGVRFKSPKSKKGRTIALLPLAVEILKEHRRHQLNLRRVLGDAYHDLDLICSCEDGSIWAPDAFSSSFVGFARRAGLKGVRLHDMRHTHATQLLRQGVHPKVVSERLGHSNIGITLDIYSHVLPGMQEDAAQKLEGVLRYAIQTEQSTLLV